MTSRRALIVAPLYDGEWLPQLPGRPLFIERLTACLNKYGNYDIKKLSGVVEEDVLRTELDRFFDTDGGELLFYFYGHGCLRKPDFGVFATSSARPNKEGVLMLEVTRAANASKAREVVMIVDCCHAGAAVPVTNSVVEPSARGLAPGRDLLVGCASHQQGWEAGDAEDNRLGAFSACVLRGLEGKARDREHNKVRGSMLGVYVTETFRSWNQDPLVVTNEGGSRFCIITSGFPDEPAPAALIGKKSPLVIGVPFKPSHLFEGRAAELDYLRALLVDQNKHVAVSATVEGLGGIGKTELVLQLLNEPDIVAAFDTVVWLDGAGPLPPQWSKVAGQLGLSELSESPEEMVAAVAAGLRDRGHSLIILDNAYEWRAVSNLIPGGFPLLVTTRKKWFGGNNFLHSELGVLPDEAAERFLVSMVPELVNDPELPALVRALDGHALALELAGWSINHLGLSASEYVGRLSAHHEESDLIVSAVRYGKTVDSCLALTWESLRLEASRTLWRRASLFAPTSAHRELLRASFVGDEETRREMRHMLGYERYLDLSVLFTRPAEFEEAFAELRAFHVLSRVEGSTGERWAMHRLVRDFGRARLKAGEVMIHAMNFSEWLKHPSLPLGPETPHFVVAILDAAKHVGEFRGMLGRRSFGREIFFRSSQGEFAFDVEEFINFIRDQLRDPKALTIILEGLTDINEDVRAQAIRLLKSIGPIPEVLDGLAASLDDSNSRIQTLAGRALAQHGGTHAIQVLSDVLKSPKPRARLAAVQTLGLMGDRAHPVLIEALTHVDAGVRIEAATLLCKAGRREGVPVLVEKFGSASEQEQLQLIDDMGACGDVRVVGTLARVCRQSPNPAHRAAAVRALNQIETEGTDLYPLFVTLLEDESRDVRAAAAQAIEKSGRLDDEADILTLLESESKQGRIQPSLIIALLRIAVAHNLTLSPAAAASLLKAPDTGVRGLCAETLGRQGNRRAVPLLIDALGDDDEGVRAKVVEALILLDDADARTALAEVISGGAEVRKRVAAIEVLTKLRDADVYPLLLELVKGDDAVLRRAAAAAIEVVNPREGAKELLAVFAARHDKPLDDHFTAIVLRLALEQKVALPTGLVMRLLKSGDGQVRQLSIAAAGSAKVREAVPFLISLFGERGRDNLQIRAAAAKALGLIRDPSAIAPLTKVAKEKYSNAAKAAAAALIRLGADAVVSAAFMEGQSLKALREFIAYLGAEGVAEAASILSNLLTDENIDASLKAEAAKSLGMIGEVP